jgi:hypothetical protein
MSDLIFNTDEEFFAAQEEFYKKHPEVPRAKEIECLNLIMKKEYAQQIVEGTKKLEFRNYTDFYTKRLVDEDVARYIQEHQDDDEAMAFCNDIRQVKKIHFYSYSNTWHLDVEVECTDIFSLVKEDMEMLHEDYGVHDFDSTFEMYEKGGIPAEERPWIFYFVIGKVLDSNL